jgi:hypothetical protein
LPKQQYCFWVMGAMLQSKVSFLTRKMIV